MGLDASVMCSCHAQGKATPCPFPADFIINEDGYPALNLPYDGHEAAHDAFEEWLNTGCPHPGMDYLNRYIGSWKSYHAFRDALASIGWEYFRVLERTLPLENHGQMSVMEARFALQELNRFSGMDGIERPFLLNTETDEPVGNLAYGGVLNADARTGIQFRYDQTGFSVIDTWEFNRELFRAVRFTQELNTAEPDRPPTYIFTDLDSGRRFPCSTPVKVYVQDAAGQMRQHYPRQMHVGLRTVEPAYFAPVVEPLQAVLRAALEMGNPVRWG
jgi:hypothetical protein